MNTETEIMTLLAQFPSEGDMQVIAMAELWDFRRRCIIIARGQLTRAEREEMVAAERIRLAGRLREALVPFLSAAPSLLDVGAAALSSSPAPTPGANNQQG